MILWTPPTTANYNLRVSTSVSILGIAYGWACFGPVRGRRGVGRTEGPASPPSRAHPRVLALPAMGALEPGLGTLSPWVCCFAYGWVCCFAYGWAWVGGWVSGTAVELRRALWDSVELCGAPRGSVLRGVP